MRMFFWDPAAALKDNVGAAVTSFFDLGNELIGAIRENTRQLAILRRGVVGLTVDESQPSAMVSVPEGDLPNALRDYSGVDPMIVCNNHISECLASIREDLGTRLTSEVIQTLSERNGQLEVRVAELEKELAALEESAEGIVADTYRT